MEPQEKKRRILLQSAALASGGILLAADSFAAGQSAETNATEDLMREHGVLRRALMIYGHCAAQLRAGKPQGLAKPLNQAAQLFRRFGEDYHERALEETYIFPMLLKDKPPISRYPSLLIAQHRKGREVTDYVMNSTRTGSIPGGSVTTLAKTLDAFTLMYAHHANREDTEVFVAWKNSMPAAKFEDMTHTFGEVEQHHVGDNGFEDAVKQISEIEQQLGIADLSQFTVRNVPGT